MNKLLTTFGLFFIALLISCSSDTVDCPTIKKSVNPNGQSELADLMHDMLQEAHCMKAHMDAGKSYTPSVDYEAIMTAHATEPDKVATDTYQAFGEDYMAIMKDMYESNLPEQLVLYERLVNNCQGCHEALCPGPLVRIAKLR